MRRRFMTKKNKFSKNGVYILNNEYKLYTKQNFNGHPDSVIGIVIITNNYAFMIGKTKISSIWKFSNSITSYIPYCYAAIDKNLAANDFNGRNNSKSIMEYDSNNAIDTAAKMCNSYRFIIEGNGGYCGSLGEYLIVFNHLTQINIILRHLNYPTFDESYWTSTQGNESTAWVINFANYGVYALTAKSKSEHSLVFKEIPDAATYYE